MRLARAITLFAAGAATAWYLDQRRSSPGMEHTVPAGPPDTLPRDPEPAAPPPSEPVEEGEAEEDTEDALADEEVLADEEPLEDEEALEHEEAFAEPEEEEAPPDPPAAGSTRRGPPPVPAGGEGPPRHEAYPPPDPAFAAPSEQPTVEQPAVQRGAEPADVAAVVDDLIASGHPEGGEHAIVDAEIVEETVVPEPPNDARIAVAVIVELGKVPGLAADAVAVAVTDGVVRLQGEVGDPGTIAEVERRVGALDGVERVSSLLHPPGNPPPA